MALGPVVMNREDDGSICVMSPCCVTVVLYNVVTVSSHNTVWRVTLSCYLTVSHILPLYMLYQGNMSLYHAMLL